MNLQPQEQEAASLSQLNRLRQEERQKRRGWRRGCSRGMRRIGNEREVYRWIASRGCCSDEVIKGVHTALHCAVLRRLGAFDGASLSKPASGPPGPDALHVPLPFPCGSSRAEITWKLAGGLLPENVWSWPRFMSVYCFLKFSYFDFCKGLVKKPQRMLRVK